MLNIDKFRQRLLRTTVLCGAVMSVAAAAPAFAQESSTAPNNPGQQVPPQPGAAAAATAAQQRQAGAPDNGVTSPAGQAPAAPVEQPNQTAPTATSGATVSGVTVTGSRIRRNEFTSAAPIQVITSEQSTLEGLTDTSQILQQSSVAESSNQINNFFTGFVLNGGPGVNTLSLRGLGAQRTLIILNGRRMGPAGVSGSVGAVDLNTIPSQMIDHVEILKDGASSIYGSDAIAGVVNIITKKNLDGGNLQFTVNPAQRAGGEQWDLSGSWGKTFNRGYITVGAEVYRQEALRYGDRDYLSCAQDLAVSPTSGQPIDIIDPSTGKSQCYNYYTRAIINASNGLRYNIDPTATRGTANYGQNLNGLARVNFAVRQPCNGIPANDPRLVGNTAANANCPVDIGATENLFSQQRQDDPRYLLTSAISPVRRYSISATGAFDLTPHAQLYGELLLNRRDSHQTEFRQFFPIVNPRNPFNPFNPAAPNYSGGPLSFAEPIIAHEFSFTERVDYARAVLGVRGDVPDFAFFHNWNYDLYGQYSRSKGTYGNDAILNDRVNATAGAGAAGCDPNAISLNSSNQTAAGTLAGMEGPNAQCLAVNYFTPAVIKEGLFTPAEAAYLFTYDEGHTTYDHGYIEGSISGDLFNLPAGAVGAALGFQVRHESINDVPSLNAQRNNLWGQTVSGITKGSDTVKEAFGELEIPILKNVPLFESLTANVSGRYSDYRSYGSSATYGIGLNWQLVPWFRVRGTHNTGFRAPALYELFLGNQTGFLGQTSIDPCINYGQSSNSALIKNCSSQGIPANYTGVSPNGGGGSGTIFTAGGAGLLKAETSRSDTVGFVFTPKWFNLDFSMAVDWYSTSVFNQIQQFGAGNIVTSCYTSPNFPSDAFCSLFQRDLNPASPSYLNILVVNNNYVNVARQDDQGLDATFRFRHRLPYDINFTFDSQLSWTFYQRTLLLGGTSANTLGGTRFPPFVGNVNLRFDQGPWTFNWFVNMIGHSSDNNFNNLGVNNPALQQPTLCPGTTNGTLCGGFHNTGTPAYRNYVQPFYAIQNISLRRKFEDFTITVGVKNLFDKLPDAYSVGGNGRIGDTRLRSQEELVGRSFFLTVNKRF